MKSYNQIIDCLAQKKYDLFMGGDNDTRVDCSVVSIVYGMTETQVENDINLRFNNIFKNKDGIDSTVKALLIYAKKEGSSFNWHDIVNNCLGELYSRDMKLADVVHVVNKAYQKLCEEVRFETTYNCEKIMLSPIHSHSTSYLGYQITNSLTIEEFYNRIVIFIMYEFMFARIDWRREELHGL